MSPRAPRLDLDFVAVRWRAGLSGWLLLLLGLAAAYVVVHDYQGLDQALQTTEQSRERLARRADQTRLRQLATARETVPEPEIRKANGVAHTLGRPWAQLFAALDAVADPEVVLTRLEPSGAKGTMAVTGEARSLQELFDYAHRLGTRPGIREARVDSYAFRDVGAAHSVSFALTARWGDER